MGISGFWSNFSFGKKKQKKINKQKKLNEEIGNLASKIGVLEARLKEEYRRYIGEDPTDDSIVALCAARKIIHSLCGGDGSDAWALFKAINEVFQGTPFEKYNPVEDG